MIHLYLSVFRVAPHTAHRATLLAIVVFNVLTDILVENTLNLIAIQAYSINRVSLCFSIGFFQFKFFSQS